MLLDGIPEIAEVIGERDRGEEAEKEFAAQVFAIDGADDGCLELLIAHKNVVFDSERVDSGDDVEGVDDVHAHDTGQDTEKVAERDAVSYTHLTLPTILLV